MFRNIFLLAVSTSILATIACMAYATMYFSLLVDFSEVLGIVKVLTNCVLVSMAACIVFYIINAIIKKANIAEFLFNLIVTFVSIATVFLILKSDDPEFKNEDALLMIDYYKGFVMPMLFFPALAWFTLKPLFIKHD